MVTFALRLKSKECTHGIFCNRLPAGAQSDVTHHAINRQVITLDKLIMCWLEAHWLKVKNKKAYQVCTSRAFNPVTASPPLPSRVASSLTTTAPPDKPKIKAITTHLAPSTQ